CRGLLTRARSVHHLYLASVNSCSRKSVLNCGQREGEIDFLRRLKPPSPRRTRIPAAHASARFPTSFSSVASRLFSRARHRRHPSLLLRRIRRSIIREILANAPAVGSKSIGNWPVGRQRQHHIQHIVAERASIEAGHLKCGGRSKHVRQRAGTKPCSDLLPVFTRVRRRTGIGRQ